MTKATRTDDGPGRITAPPGTDEYNRQFRRQALHAAEAALALWTVRIPCGMFALVFAASLVEGWVDASAVDIRLLGFTASALMFLIELGNVALRGKSLYLRLLFSGVGPEDVALDEVDDTK